MLRAVSVKISRVPFILVVPWLRLDSIQLRVEMDSWHALVTCFFKHWRPARE
jgi:hypothetical protein